MDSSNDKIAGIGRQQAN